jgi:hypothetical protein
MFRKGCERRLAYRGTAQPLDVPADGSYAPTLLAGFAGRLHAVSGGLNLVLPLRHCRFPLPS